MNTFLDLGDKPMLRRAGTLAFAFFFIKGLLWLAAPFVFWLLV